MAKKKKPRRNRNTAASLRPNQCQMNIPKEVAYIVGRAQGVPRPFCDPGPLVFFSTASGDAWMLDVEDNFAICLARDASPHAIEWDHVFHIHDNAFTTESRDGKITTIMDYPIPEIQAAIWRAIV